MIRTRFPCTIRCGVDLAIGADMKRYYIRTQRLGAYVGGDGSPELFASRSEARRRADSLRTSTPSKYGRLIVSEYRGGGR